MLKIILPLITLSLQLEAAEYKIQYNNFHATIKASADDIVYQDSITDLSLKKKQCNSHIVDRLLKELVDQSKNMSEEKIQNYKMTVAIDGQKQTIDQRSKKGQFFYKYIEVIKQAKIEEMLSCQ